MPHYDYVCETCEKQFEVFQSMNDKRLTKCPEKGCKGKVRRLIGTGAGLVFKGSGFYSEGYKAAAKQDSASAASSSSPAPAAPAAAPASAAPPVAAPAKESGKKSKPAQ
jgi:putative FmdB family regulatory protein